MKDELGWQIMTKFAVLSEKTFSYLIDDTSEDKNVKGIKSVPWKGNLNLRIIKTV